MLEAWDVDDIMKRDIACHLHCISLFHGDGSHASWRKNGTQCSWMPAGWFFSVLCVVKSSSKMTAGVPTNALFLLLYTSRPPVEFSTDLKFRQTALSNNQNCIAWKKSYKNETGRIFRTNWLLWETAHSEAVTQLVSNLLLWMEVPYVWDHNSK